MVKKTVTKKRGSKRSRLARFYRSRGMLKLRRKIANYQKQIKSWIRNFTKFGNNPPHVMESLLQSQPQSSPFFTPLRIAIFCLLFLISAGGYLWFQLSSSSPKEVASPALQNIAPKREVRLPFSSHQDGGMPSEIAKEFPDEDPVQTGEVDTTFTMQPYLDNESSLSLIKTINPQFFIEAADNQKQKVAILVVGLGISESLTEEVIEQLPKNISLVFSSYTEYLEDVIEWAQFEGFATLIAAPLEDEDPVTDQGYLTLKTRVPAQENLANLKKITAYAKNTDCIYGQKGARLLRSAKDLEPVLQYIRDANNCFVAPPDPLVSRLHEIAASIALNYVSTTVENPTAAMMPLLEALTKRTGFSILAFDAKPGIVEEINEWLEKLQESDLAVVPITEIIRR